MKVIENKKVLDEIDKNSDILIMAKIYYKNKKQDRSYLLTYYMKAKDYKKNEIIKKIEVITELEIKIRAELNHDEVIKKYWGNSAWSSTFEEREETESNLVYAVYNDKIDDSVQFGTLTEILDEDNHVIDYLIYRTII